MHTSIIGGCACPACHMSLISEHCGGQDSIATMGYPHIQEWQCSFSFFVRCELDYHHLSFTDKKLQILSHGDNDPKHVRNKAEECYKQKGNR